VRSPAPRRYRVCVDHGEDGSRQRAEDQLTGEKSSDTIVRRVDNSTDDGDPQRAPHDRGGGRRHPVPVRRRAPGSSGFAGSLPANRYTSKLEFFPDPDLAADDAAHRVYLIQRSPYGSKHTPSWPPDSTRADQRRPDDGPSRTKDEPR
jgi:hypothetical protein